MCLDYIITKDNYINDLYYDCIKMPHDVFIPSAKLEYFDEIKTSCDVTPTSKKRTRESEIHKCIKKTENSNACMEDGCDKTAIYKYKRNKKMMCCEDHKLPLMFTNEQIQCRFHNCAKLAKYKISSNIL